MRLVVFFSRGMSLDGWRRAGILDRELALYRGLAPSLSHLAFVTYGGAEDLALVAQLPGVEILPNRWRLPSNLYSVLAPLLHRRTLSAATVFRTNQLNGAWCAVIAKRLYGKKLIVRCGFLWSDFVARLHGGTWRVAASRRIEQWVCRAADLMIVAGEADRTAIVERYGLDPSTVQVVPNYVDTAMFRPMPEVAREPGRITFVGRFEDQKNLPALIEAVGRIPGSTLALIGDGPLRDRLRADADRFGASVEFLGTRPHAELPALLNRSTVSVLPSHYEGNPKALFEAMACGLPVVGARVPGIRDVIVHRDTGFLCGTSSGEIAAALQEVLDDAALRSRMSVGAVTSAQRWSVEAVVDQERALLRALDAGAN